MSAVVDIEHLHGAGLVVNAVDDTVGPAPRAVTASQRAEQRFAYPAWAQGQGFGSLAQRRTETVLTLTSRMVTVGWGAASK